VFTLNTQAVQIEPSPYQRNQRQTGKDVAEMKEDTLTGALSGEKAGAGK
jgi:hypothetical protein